MMKENNNAVAFLPLCVGVGVALGTVMDNISMGVALGAAVGGVLSVAAAASKDKKDETE